MKEDLQKRLIQFALNTLQVLESDSDWSSETADNIASCAHNLGLSNSDSCFKSLVIETADSIYTNLNP